MKYLIFFCLLAVLLLCGCGGSGTAPDPGGTVNPPAQPDPPITGGDALEGTVIRSPSGNPTGIRITWLSVDDSTLSGSPIIGYHIYKSDEPIPLSARGDGSYWLDVGGDPLIPQAAELGDMIVVDDVFPVAFGEEWHYRLTSVAADGDESRLSAETTVTIAQFSISFLLTLTTEVGSDFWVRGENFGIYDPLTDKVEVTGVEWQAGVGFVAVKIDAPVVDWQTDMIQATLPLGATVGPVDVTVGGITLSTIQNLENADPYITNLTPLAANITEFVTLEGGNFGEAQGADNLVVFSGATVPEPAQYGTYSDDTITFRPPNLQDYQSHSVMVRVAETDSNEGFLDLTNAPPVANVTANPTTGTAPVRIQFDGGMSLDPENPGPPTGGITKYEWDLDGDGTFELDGGLIPSREVQFNTPGLYTVGLRVTDVEGATGEATIDVTINDPPQADLQSDVTTGPVPLDVNFDASASNDPDNASGGINGLGIFDFEWDFDGDGTFNEADNGEDLAQGDPIPAYTYNTAGTYNATVRVTDDDGAQDTAAVQIDVTTNPVVLADEGSIAAGNLFGDTAGLSIRHSITGGIAPYTIEWFLVDNAVPPVSTRIATDNPPSVGSYQHVFTIDTTTTVVVADSNTIPLGTWQIRGEPTDQDPLNDPDAPHTWPDLGGSYNLYRYNVVVVQDDTGDPLGAESTAIKNALDAMGYLTTQVSATGLTLGDIVGFHACIWASDGPVGSAGVPFNWLGFADLTLIMSYVDIGKATIIFSAPLEDSIGRPFPQDNTFSDNYQPFQSVKYSAAVNDLYFAQNYTSDYQYLVNQFDHPEEHGFTDDPLWPFAETQIEILDDPNLSIAAVRQGPVAGNTYFAMCQFSQIINLLPAGATSEQLLDNIVAGTIVWVPPN